VPRLSAGRNTGRLITLKEGTISRCPPALLLGGTIFRRQVRTHPRRLGRQDRPAHRCSARRLSHLLRPQTV